MRRIVKTLKNEKGLTLVELLAVVVILGIIGAIAVPSIGGIIENSKKDAHIANAQQMINSAKLVAVSELTTKADNKDYYVTLAYLVKNGYLDPVEDPFDNTLYDSLESTSPEVSTLQEVNGGGTKPENVTDFIVIKKKDNKFTYEVTLNSSSTFDINGRTENELTREDAFTDN